MSTSVRKVILWVLILGLLLYDYNFYHSASVITTGTYVMLGFIALVALGLVYLALNFDRIYAKNMAQAKQSKKSPSKGLKVLGILMIVVSVLDLLINLAGSSSGGLSKAIFSFIPIFALGIILIKTQGGKN